MKKFHYSWLVCASCTLLLICTMGFCNNVFPVYLPYLERELLTGAQGSSLISIRCIFGILGMLFVQRFYRAFSLRAGLAISCALTAAAFALYAAADTPWMFRLGAAVSGIGYGLGSMIPVAILIRNWFHSHGSVAIGLCSAGSGISTIIFPPLITKLIEVSGVSAGFWLQCGISALAGTVIFAVVRDAPAERGLAPYGESHMQREAESVEPPRTGCAKAGTNAAQWGCLLIGAVAATATGHFSAYFSSLGYPALAVSVGISVFGAFLTVSKPLCGAQFDRHGGEQAGTCFLLVALAGCGVSCLADGKTLPLMYVSLTLMGVGFSTATVGVPVWAAEFSSENNYRDILRRFQISYAIGSAIFSSFPGVIYDHTGSYRETYLLMALLLGGTAVLLKTAYHAKRKKPA